MNDQRFKRSFRRILKFVLFGIFGIFGVAALGFVTMSLWNILMPAIFALKTISYWQALGLLVLSKILFGGFRSGAGNGRHWRRRMTERWEQMTPEQREKFKQGMRRGCGPRPQATEAEAQA